MKYSGFFTSKELEERYKISARTLHRWQNCPVKNFPKPTIPASGSFNRWAVEVIDEWESRIQERKAA